VSICKRARMRGCWGLHTHKHTYTGTHTHRHTHTHTHIESTCFSKHQQLTRAGERRTADGSSASIFCQKKSNIVKRERDQTVSKRNKYPYFWQGSEEDDGWVICVMYDTYTPSSITSRGRNQRRLSVSMAILDARNLSAGPLAFAHLRCVDSSVQLGQMLPRNDYC
jgi:hypothetical protein